MRDVILAVRADESIHRDINHRFSDFTEESKACDVIKRFMREDSRFKRPSE